MGLFRGGAIGVARRVQGASSANAEIITSMSARTVGLWCRPLGYLPLMYYRAMLSGRGKLQHLMNDRYASVRPTRVQEYVAREHL